MARDIDCLQHLAQCYTVFDFPREFLKAVVQRGARSGCWRGGVVSRRCPSSRYTGADPKILRGGCLTMYCSNLYFVAPQGYVMILIRIMYLPGESLQLMSLRKWSYLTKPCSFLSLCDSITSSNSCLAGTLNRRHRLWRAFVSMAPVLRGKRIQRKFSVEGEYSKIMRCLSFFFIRWVSR